MLSIIFYIFANDKIEYCLYCECSLLLLCIFHAVFFILVLEARERNLEDKSNCEEEASENDSQILTNLNHYDKKISSSEKTISDSLTNEGVYAVKPSLKSKKGANKKVKHKETEKAKITKSEKAKENLSARQEHLKRSTRHSYALRALKSYIEVNINANEVSNSFTKYIYSFYCFLYILFTIF